MPEPTPANSVVTIRLADMEQFRLFMWGLRTLEDDMRSQSVSSQPLREFAERLGACLDGFSRQINHADDRSEGTPDGF